MGRNKTGEALHQRRRLAPPSLEPVYVNHSIGRHDRRGYVRHGPSPPCFDQIASLSCAVHRTVTIVIRIWLRTTDRRSRGPRIDRPQVGTKCDLPSRVISPLTLAAKPHYSVPCRHFQKVGDRIGDNPRAARSRLDMAPCGHLPRPHRSSVTIVTCDAAHAEGGAIAHHRDERRSHTADPAPGETAQVIEPVQRLHGRLG